MSQGKVIVVEDSKIIRLGYKDSLERRDYEVETFDSAKAALNRISFGWPGIIISDVIMPGMDGISMMKRIREIDTDLPVILITGQGDIPTAVQAIRDGAYDFLEKPFFRRSSDGSGSPGHGKAAPGWGGPCFKERN